MMNFMEKLRKYQAAEGCTFEEAFKATTRAHPDLHQRYIAQANAGRGSSGAPAGSARAAFEDKIEDLKLAHGWGYERAYRFIARRHPGLLDAYLAEANAEGEDVHV